MEGLPSDLVQQAGAAAFPLLYRMVVGLLIGLVAAVAVAIAYRKISGKSAALAGVLGVIILGGSGLLLPLSFGFEETTTTLTDTIIEGIEPELEQLMAAEGLDPQNLDPAEIQPAIDEFLAELDEAEQGAMPAAQAQRIRDIAGEIQTSIDQGEEISVGALARRVGEGMFVPVYALLPIVNAVLITISVLFIVVTMLLAVRSRKAVAGPGQQA